MTAVEFFDRSPIENVVSSLTTTPDKIIFIGDKKQMDRTRKVYERFFAYRGLTTQLDFKPIKKNDLEDIIDVLTEIVKTEPECVFDLTGGEDLLLMAMGIVSRKFPHVQMQRFNLNNGVVTDCDGDGKVLYEGTPTLTVEELIMLHGGALRYADEGKQNCTYRWDVTEEFAEDVRQLWELCRQDSLSWNKQMNAIYAIEALREDEDSLEVDISLAHVQTQMNLKGVAYESPGPLLRRLSELKLILDYDFKNGNIYYRYKNNQIRRVLEKAGTILEVKVLVEAKMAKHKNGEPYYTDAVSGAFIDWNGEYGSGDSDDKNTENEIDMILMKGLTPVFISCKNGKVEYDELYKMYSVVSHFGGPHAKKVLIATYVHKNEASRESRCLRASEMGIHLIADVDKLEPNGFVSMIKELYNKQ